MTIKTSGDSQDLAETTKKISVIIPLEYHRGFAVDCIRGWADHQDYPRDCYQILIAAPTGFDPDQLSEIQNLLQPWDRLVVSEHDHDMTLIEAAAGLADAELLLFSESHCVPQADALSYLVEVADSHRHWSAFSAPTHGMTHNLLSKIECAIYSQDIRGKLSAHTWLRVLDQCFVIRNGVYHQVGGFRGEFGHFAEWLFAATMKTHNLSLGVAQRAVISHGYIGDYNDLADFTLDFARGQIKYLDKCADEPAAALFPSLPELNDFKLRTFAERRRAYQYTYKDCRRTLFVGLRKFLHREDVGPICDYWHWLTASRIGANGNFEKLHAQAKVQADIARTQLEHAVSLGHQETARTCFVEWFARLVKQGRYAYLAETYGDSSPAVNEQVDTLTNEGAWSVDDGALMLRMFNVHDAEGTQDGGIRWTLPTVQLFLPLQAGNDYSLVIHWSKARPLNRSDLIRVRLDGKELASSSIQFQSTQLQLKTNIAQSGWHELTISVYPFHGMGDGRLLGLPLQAVHWFSGTSHTNVR